MTRTNLPPPGASLPVAQVGVMAHNEEANIASAIRSIAAQSLSCARLGAITVVASGCTDGTVAVVRACIAEEPRLVLIEQPRREGKASAVRAFLRSASGADLIVLAGADTRLRAGALEALLAPFADPGVGMTGGHPIPGNPPRGLVNRAVRLLWRLHHEISLLEPKMGELVAFRNVLADFPADTAVDEASAEQMIRQAGLRVVYAPEAEVEMRGPATLGEFLSQRRRIHAGHRALSRATGYRVSTMRPALVLRALRGLRPLPPGEVPHLLAAAALEALARLLGWWDERIAGRDHVVWSVASSTKRLGTDAPEAGRRP